MTDPVRSATLPRSQNESAIDYTGERITYDAGDLKRLKQLDALASEAWKAFVAFDKAAMAEGALTVMTKELIAVAGAHTTQCPFCIDAHVKKARKAGATDPELAEAAMVAAALGAGGDPRHAHALRLNRRSGLLGADHADRPPHVPHQQEGADQQADRRSPPQPARSPTQPEGQEEPHEQPRHPAPDQV